MNISSILDSIDSLQQKDMTFEEYEQFYMLADELVHYLEGIVEVEGTNQNLSSH